jgi:hypothetical protein
VWITCFTVADYVHVFVGEALASDINGFVLAFCSLNEIHYLCFMISKIMIAYGLIVYSGFPVLPGGLCPGEITQIKIDFMFEFTIISH